MRGGAFVTGQVSVLRAAAVAAAMFVLSSCNAGVPQASAAVPPEGPWLGIWLKRPQDAGNPSEERLRLQMVKEGDGFKLTIHRVLPTGEPVLAETTSAKFDGRPYPVQGSDSVDHDIFTRINDRTYGLIDMFSGQETARFVIHVSDDDRVRTSTSHRVNGQGQISSSVGVWDRVQ